MVDRRALIEGLSEDNGSGTILMWKWQKSLLKIANLSNQSRFRRLNPLRRCNRQLPRNFLSRQNFPSPYFPPQRYPLHLP